MTGLGSHNFTPPDRFDPVTLAAAAAADSDVANLSR